MTGTGRDLPPHPASASLGHPLPVGERRLAKAAAFPSFLGEGTRTPQERAGEGDYPQEVLS